MSSTTRTSWVHKFLSHEGYTPTVSGVYDIKGKCKPTFLGEYSPVYVKFRYNKFRVVVT